MNLVRLLLYSSKATAFLAVAAGLAVGAGSVALLALVHAAMKQDDTPASSLAWRFVAVCIAVLLVRVGSQAVLIRLGQGWGFNLYTRLSRQILATPLRQLEMIGTPRLLAVLTEDVPATTAALLGVPIFCVNAAIFLCCLAYLAWLSLSLFFGVLIFSAVGVFSYLFPVIRAVGHLHRARQEHDALMEQFRGLTEGVKELQMHHGRRETFLRDLLGVTAANLRDRNIAGLTLYAAAGTWGQLLFFVCLGLLLFFAPSVRVGFAREVLGGYVITILYAAAPLETIMTWLPVLGRGRVALRAVEELGLSLVAPRGEGDTATKRRTPPAYNNP